MVPALVVRACVQSFPGEEQVEGVQLGSSLSRRALAGL